MTTSRYFCCCSLVYDVLSGWVGDHPVVFVEPIPKRAAVRKYIGDIWPDWYRELFQEKSGSLVRIWRTV